MLKPISGWDWVGLGWKSLNASLLRAPLCGADKCCKEKTEVISGENDPLMKLLASALIILAVNLIVTK